MKLDQAVQLKDALRSGTVPEDVIQRIREELRKARDDYYNLTPSMSDQEYDAKKDFLAKHSPDDVEVTAVGASPPKHKVWDEVRHKIPMGSLDKVNEADDFHKWASGTGASRFLITHKIDGSSMELVYEDGRLVRCVTRGDGVVGEDVTVNVSRIPTVPKTIPIREDVTVRGEVVMRKSVFDAKYAAEYANPRNTAAGKVRDKKRGGEACEDLDFVAFTLMSATAPATEQSRFLALSKMGFAIPDHFVGSASEVVEWHIRTCSERSTIPYEIDGTVTRVDSIPDQEALGDRHMRPRGQMAFKFDPAMGATRMVDVKWQIGPTGRCTPVAVVEPVDVGGVTITNVSLHNLVMFRELALAPGDEVLISRRNDVIPYVERNLSAEGRPSGTSSSLFPIPGFCSVCSAPSVEDGDFLFCRSKSCPAKLAGAVKVWVRNLGLLHWGDALIDSLTDPDQPAIGSVADLYRLSVDAIAERCSGTKFAQKCHDTLHGNKSLPLDLVIASLNIPNFGLSTASDVVGFGIDTVDKVLAATVKDFEKAPNVGEKTAACIFEGIQSKREVLLDLVQVLNIRGPVAAGPLRGMTVCITGELSRPRKAVEKAIMDAGGSPKSSVSKDTTYLVTNFPDSGSSKMKSAKKYGVKVIDEAGLYRIIGGSSQA